MISRFAQHDEIRDYHRLFYVKITDPLMILQKKFRSEEEYDDDPENPKMTAFTQIEHLARCLSVHTYSVIGEFGQHLPSRVRSWKGFLWDVPKLKQLPNIEYEVPVSERYTKMISTVNLENCMKDIDGSTIELLLYTDSSFIVLTDLSLETMANYTKYWLEKDEKGEWPINHEAVAKDLKHLKHTAVLRHFAADNGHHEIIAIMGHKDFLMKKVKPCLEEMTIK